MFFSFLQIEIVDDVKVIGIMMMMKTVVGAMISIDELPSSNLNYWKCYNFCSVSVWKWMSKWEKIIIIYNIHFDPW